MGTGAWEIQVVSWTRFRFNWMYKFNIVCRFISFLSELHRRGRERNFLSFRRSLRTIRMTFLALVVREPVIHVLNAIRKNLRLIFYLCLLERGGRRQAAASDCDPMMYLNGWSLISLRHLAMSFPRTLSLASPTLLRSLINFPPESFSEKMRKT